MSARRFAKGIERPPPVAIAVDGRRIMAHPGESVATALLAAGIAAFRASPRAGTPRGPLCLMGVCQECVVTIDGRRVPACQEPVRAGMRVSLGTAE